MQIPQKVSTLRRILYFTDKPCRPGLVKHNSVLREMENEIVEMKNKVKEMEEKPCRPGLVKHDSVLRVAKEEMKKEMHKERWIGFSLKAMVLEEMKNKVKEMEEKPCRPGLVKHDSVLRVAKEEMKIEMEKQMGKQMEEMKNKVKEMEDQLKKMNVENGGNPTKVND